ncbi:MAG: hypothetical protein IPN29_05920 [Saprospiraceae bacterium]|nr:hypothetical protein [Saprospiraceae bacterium]
MGHTRPSNLSVNMVDETGKLEGWLRIKIKLSSDIDIKTLSFISRTWAAMDVFIDGKPLHSFGNTGSNDFPFTENNNFNNEFIHLQLEPQKEYLIALHIVDYKDPIFNKLKSTSYINLFTLADSKFLGIERMFLMAGSFISAVIATLALLFWFLYFQNSKEEHLLLLAIMLSCLCGNITISLIQILSSFSYSVIAGLDFVIKICTYGVATIMPLTLAKVFERKNKPVFKILRIIGYRIWYLGLYFEY